MGLTGRALSDGRARGPVLFSIQGAQRIPGRFRLTLSTCDYGTKMQFENNITEVVKYGI